MQAKTSALTALPSLSPRALYEEVAELLRQRIFKREMEPGTWIDELKLAQAYGISRTPLREALKVLAAEGLVTMKVRRGAYVTEVSTTDMADVYHLLSLLESDAAGVVAQKASDTELTDLKNLHAELETAALPGVSNADQFFAINERFHMRLLEIANNRWRDQMVADAQGDEVKPPQLLTQKRAHARVAQRASGLDGCARKTRCSPECEKDASALCQWLGSSGLILLLDHFPRIHWNFSTQP